MDISAIIRIGRAEAASSVAEQCLAAYNAPREAAREARQLSGEDAAKLVEVLLCCPAGAGRAPEKLLLGLCRVATRKQLWQLLAIIPTLLPAALEDAQPTHVHGYSKAGAALHASTLPVISVVASPAGFSLCFNRESLALDGHGRGEGECRDLSALPGFGQTAWRIAMEACREDPELAGAYPTSDPGYASHARETLLRLGPAAAGHATADDAALMATWVENDDIGGGGLELDNSSKTSWLESAIRMLRSSETLPASFQALVGRIAERWAVNGGDDSGVLASSREALVVAGSASSFTAVVPLVKSQAMAASAVRLLGLEQPRQEVLDVVLTSSSLTAATASAHLKAAQPNPVVLGALVVRGNQASTDPWTHPAAQLIDAVPELPLASLFPLFEQLITVEREKLPVEGSPHGEAHWRHVRLWVSIGSLLMHMEDPATADQAAAAAEAALRSTGRAPLPQTRVLLQNVWARAVWVSLQALPAETPPALTRLVGLLEDPSRNVALAPPCVASAAQLLLHPDHGSPAASGTSSRSKTEASLDGNHLLQPLLRALLPWSLSYAHKPRFLATLALYHAVDRGLIETPGWYLESLSRFVKNEAAFNKMRLRLKLDEWVSDAWGRLRYPSRGRRSLDLDLTWAQKHISNEFWTPQGLCLDALDSPKPEAQVYQTNNASASTKDDRLKVAIVGSLLDNVPNMAGLVRTAESLLGPNTKYVTKYRLLPYMDT